MRTRGIARRATVLLVVLGLVAGLAACGGTSSNSSSSGGAGGSPKSGKHLKFIYISNNPSSAPIGAIISNAFQAAGRELGADVEYRATTALSATPAEVKRLLQNAIASHPDGLVVSDWLPSSLNATIKSATDQGIPVVLAQTGAGQTQATGALTYVGNDETAAGRLGGQMLAKTGAKHALLVTLPPGIPIVDDRNTGFEQGFHGTVTKLAVKNFNDVTGMTNAILASLQKDPSIDSVFNVGIVFSAAELAAQQKLGPRAKQIKWAALDIGPQVLQAVNDGRYLFALDQQPYLQGYLPVLFLKQYIELGLEPAEQQVPTGPSAITHENIKKVIALSSKKLR